MRRQDLALVVGTVIAAVSGRASAQSESLFLTVPASTVGTHLEFANTAGSGANTRFILWGAADHADSGPPPGLHTMVIDFEWRIAPGPDHDFTNWGVSHDFITTVVGGMTNTFSTGEFITPGAWDTVAVHLYTGFPISVSATFDHSWTDVPAPGPLALLGLAALSGVRRRR